jgi:hypothetical protein
VRPVGVELQFLSQEQETRKLTIKQAKISLRNHKERLLGFKPANRHQPTDTAVDRKYQKPSLRPIAPEQAKLFLMGRATVGDRGAKDLMELIFFCRSTQRWESPDGATTFNPSNVYGQTRGAGLSLVTIRSPTATHSSQLGIVSSRAASRAPVSWLK